VVAGLHEFHNLGFIHRDLKTENILLNDTRPIKVALIDIDQSLPRTNKSRSRTRETPGYKQEGARYQDGNIEWDIYSLVAIIVERNMERDAYMLLRRELVNQLSRRTAVRLKGHPRS